MNVTISNFFLYDMMRGMIASYHRQSSKMAQDSVHRQYKLGIDSFIGMVISKHIGVDSCMHSTRKCSSTPLQQPIDWVDFRPGSSLLSLSNLRSCHNPSSLAGNAHPARPVAIRGAMQEGWPAADWTPRDLLERCGDREVPLEVSSGGGDYRDAYDDARSRPGRTFDAGVSAPLSLLVDAMQSTQVRRACSFDPS